MLVMAQDARLASLIADFEDWFRDLALEAPIGQFQLDDNCNNHSDANGTRSRREDRIKLGIITRTTTSWFKSLARPPITDHDLALSDDELEAHVRTNEGQTEAEGEEEGEEEEDTQLDKFAKDLEQLLGGNRKDRHGDDNDVYDHASNNDSVMMRNGEQQADIYYFSNYITDELALADPEIGHCCAIETSPRTNGGSTQAMTVLQSSLCSGYRASNDLSDDSGQLSKPHSDRHTQTPMPADHDYLARPKQKPLLMCNRISREHQEPSLHLIAKRQRLSSVLNTGAIKRFARFSERLRLLSCE